MEKEDIVKKKWEEKENEKPTRSNGEFTVLDQEIGTITRLGFWFVLSQVCLFLNGHVTFTCKEFQMILEYFESL